MFFLLLILLQSQTRLSKVVIVGAALVLIIGVTLLVYFYRRYKRTEGEPEEDWDLSRSSLFANIKPAAGSSEAAASVSEPKPAPEQAPIDASTRVPASEPAVSSPAPVAEAAEQPPAPPRVEPTEHRPTEVFASPPPAETRTEREPGFDEEVWSGIESGERPPIAGEHLAERSARVDERSHLETFEPPRIEPISHQEPFEPPRIEPLASREQPEAVTREIASPIARRAGETAIFGSISGADKQAKSDSSRKADWATAGSAAGTKSRYAPAGTVLGISAETSDKPLILGQPSRRADETGIEALSNYGKDPDKTGGRAGSIALLVVLLLFGGGVALYLLVPSINARVNNFVAHLRGTDKLAAIEAANKVRAQVIPSYRQEVNKNMVTARGAVDNISDAPLENLSIEVSLIRGGDAAPEVRTIPVTPSPLPPGQRGTFEFQYDGKRDSGFSAYKITRLLSNGTEVKFKAPGK